MAHWQMDWSWANEYGTWDKAWLGEQHPDELVGLFDLGKEYGLWTSRRTMHDHLTRRGLDRIVVTMPVQIGGTLRLTWAEDEDGRQRVVGRDVVGGRTVGKHYTHRTPFHYYYLQAMCGRSDMARANARRRWEAA